MKTEAVVEQAKAGDATAMQRLAEAHRDMALGYARHLLDDEALAEDAVQEALVIAHLRLNRLLDSNSFGAWLRGIIRNRCRNVVKDREVSLDMVEELAYDSELARRVIDASDYARLVEAITQLPDRERTALVMHYQEGLSQSEIGARIGVSKGTVNMRLHSARLRLRRRLTMEEKDIRQEPIGQVVEARGALVALKFASEELPLIFSRLTAGREELCVVRTLADGLVEAAATRTNAIWTPGQEVRDTRSPFAGALDNEVAWQIASMTNSSDRSVETGIKTIDVFAPIVDGGSTGIFCEWGLGLLVLAPELVGRLEKSPIRQTIYSFVPPIRSAREWRDINGEIARGSHKIEMLYLPVADPISPKFSAGFSGLKTKLVLSRMLAEQGIWPCIDPLRSTSGISEDGRFQVAAKVRQLLDTYYRLQFEMGSAMERSLTEEEWVTVRRARLANQFLGQPFFVAEPYTKTPGVFAAPAKAIETFGKIVDGHFDAQGRGAFTMAGATPKE